VAQAIKPLTALLLLWLGGIALRMTILATPPVIPDIHADLALSKTQIGILTGLPMVLFAGAAIAGSLMIARLGTVTAAIIGLSLCAAGSALRGVGPHVAMLYFGTIVTAFGVAVTQPAMPPLVRAWMPHRIGFATAVYTNGLLIGETLPAALTIPLVLPWLNNSWQWDFAFWGLLVALIALAVFWYAPRTATAATATAATNKRWMPDFRNPLIWRIGFLFGSVNASYFSLNGFLPDYLTHTGRPDLIHAALTALNMGQLPASLLLLISADRMVRTVWSYLICGAICLVAIMAMVFLGGTWIVVAAGIWGCFGAGVFVLALALPPLISPPEDVHRVSAGMFTISYSCAVIVPVIAGVLWDVTGWTRAPFIPITACMIVLLALAPTIVLRDKTTGQDTPHG
jgi:CP family cyanate transporter-like MFS transporter